MEVTQEIMNDLCSVSNAFFTFDIIHGVKGQGHIILTFEGNKLHLIKGHEGQGHIILTSNP
jgi:hypothetical protein